MKLSTKLGKLDWGLVYVNKNVSRRSIIQLTIGSIDSQFIICQYCVNTYSRHSAIEYAAFCPQEAKLNLITK